MIQEFLNWFVRTSYAERNTRMIRRDDTGDYLRRIYLVRTGAFGLYLHEFLGPDPDGLHDHPWNFFTLVLTGGYKEECFDGARWRFPGDFAYRRAEEFHRVDPKVGTWTLFGRFRRRRRWGFLPPGAEKLWFRVDDQHPADVGTGRSK